MPAVAWQPLVIIDFHYTENSSINLFSFPEENHTGLKTHTSLNKGWQNVKLFLYVYVPSAFNDIEKWLWNWLKIRGKTLFVCHGNSACRYTCHTEMVKNAGCGLICRQMQQFCPCQHCDVLTALTWTLPGLRRFYAELPPTCSASLACCLSIHQRTCLPVDILTISYRHVSLKAFFSVW